nr:HAD hydrolase family protein [uncultured Holophaga sp.]
MTTSHVIYDDRGVRLRPFSTRDGAGMQWLAQSGLPVGFISALDDPSTRRRGMDLGVEILCLGPQDKRATLLAEVAARGLAPTEAAYFGDDLHDLPALKVAGFSACPADAAPEVRAACHVVLPELGGGGFFRAAAELILKAQGRWETIVGRYDC